MPTFRCVTTPTDPFTSILCFMLEWLALMLLELNSSIGFHLICVSLIRVNPRTSHTFIFSIRTHFFKKIEARFVKSIRTT